MLKNFLSTCAIMLVSAATAMADDRSPASKPAERAAGDIEIRIMQGQYFAGAVPAGWNATETTNETFIAAPDASMMYGFTGLERFNTGTPIQFLQFMSVTVYKLQAFQATSAQQVVIDGTPVTEFNFTANCNGRPYKYWARVAIVQAYGATSGYMLVVAADPDKFEQVFGDLKTMALTIQVINPTGAFGRDAALAVQQRSNLNHPMDHSFADQYWKNAKRLDGVFARGSDVRRDSYISSDPTTGQRYWHTQAAFNPARGGVVNPERPTELLKPAEHWQGR